MIGSTWSKWDLHLHSPATNLNNNFKVDFLEYSRKLIESQLSLVGITNYFYFKSKELESVKSSLNQIGSEVSVLGNLEFRISQPNKQGEWINVHCLFSEHLSTDRINGVLSTLPLTIRTAQGAVVYCSETSMREHGISIDQAVVDYNKLCEHLSHNLKHGIDYLIGICPNGYGGFRPTPNGGRSASVATDIDRLGDFVFGSDESTRNFFLNSSRYENAKSKPVFSCSDAHCEADIGSRYTWIKAKPTFEGLRQVLIEPQDRVQIIDDFIDKTFVKPKFTSVQAHGSIFSGQLLSFNNIRIELNPNMVAIIGGRGTGKSILLDAIRSKFQYSRVGANNRHIDLQDLTLNLDQGDGTVISFSDKNHNYDYLHVSQGEIQKVSQDPEELSNEIKRMLGIHEVAFDPTVEASTLEALSRYRTFVNYWQMRDEVGNLINTDSHQKSIVQNYTNLINTLTSPQNKTLIENYQGNVKTINELNSFINSCTSIQNKISQQIPIINTEIAGINNHDKISEKVDSIEFETTLNGLRRNIDNVQQQINGLTIENQSISGEFQKQGINQDVASLLSKVSEYQSQIDAANLKLLEIQTKTTAYQDDVAKRGLVSKEYKAYLEKQVTDIDTAFNSLLEVKTYWNEEQNRLVSDVLTDISIFGQTYFDANKFFNGVLERLNRGKFRETSEQSTIDRLKCLFPIDNANDFFRLLSNEKVVKLSESETITLEDFCWKDEYFNQSGRFDLLDYLFSPQSIKNFLHVNAEFRYKDKTVDKLSVGQRGTFYVCLKLATDPFGSPFIFDQPEDDLDNDFIMHKLVPLFRTIKKYRQVIIVTHNANLVVNCDAEQVIVAHNDNEVLSYDSGAVEDGKLSEPDSIRSKICNILEGGEYAFELRERKYGLNT